MLKWLYGCELFHDQFYRSYMNLQNREFFQIEVWASEYVILLLGTTFLFVDILTFVIYLHVIKSLLTF